MHHKITIILVFIASSFLQDTKCGIIALPTNVDFNKKLDIAFAREYERLDMLKTLNGRYDNHPFGDDEEIQELIQKLKQLDKEAIDELTAYYDNLKAESLRNKQIPNMDEHEIEIKMFDVSPEYLQKAVETIKDALLNSKDADFLSNDDKNKILKHIEKLADLINEVAISLRSEMKNHITVWKRIDPIYLAATNNKLDKNRQPPEVQAAIVRVKNILEDCMTNNMGLFMELYDDIYRINEKFRQRKEKILKAIEHTTLDPYEQWWEDTHVGGK